MKFAYGKGPLLDHDPAKFQVVRQNAQRGGHMASRLIAIILKSRRNCICSLLRTLTVAPVSTCMRNQRRRKREREGRELCRELLKLELLTINPSVQVGNRECTKNYAKTHFTLSLWNWHIKIRILQIWCSIIYNLSIFIHKQSFLVLFVKNVEINKKISLSAFLNGADFSRYRMPIEDWIFTKQSKSCILIVSHLFNFQNNRGLCLMIHDWSFCGVDPRW